MSGIDEIFGMDNEGTFFDNIDKLLNHTDSFRAVLGQWVVRNMQIPMDITSFLIAGTFVVIIWQVISAFVRFVRFILSLMWPIIVVLAILAIISIIKNTETDLFDESIPLCVRALRKVIRGIEKMIGKVLTAYWSP